MVKKENDQARYGDGDEFGSHNASLTQISYTNFYSSSKFRIQAVKKSLNFYPAYDRF